MQLDKCRVSIEAFDNEQFFDMRERETERDRERERDLKPVLKHVKALLNLELRGAILLTKQLQSMHL
jgi:hypothetical protein